MPYSKHINVKWRVGSDTRDKARVKASDRASSRVNLSKLSLLALLGLIASTSISLVGSEPTNALTCDENSMVSCIDISFGEVVGSTDLKAPSSTSTSHGIDRAYFYLPVSLTIARANDYSIKVYSQNGGDLRSKSGDTIPTLTGEAGKGTALTDLGKDGSVWGYRYHLGETASDPEQNYLKVPSSTDTTASIITNEPIVATSGTVKRVLTLGFATAVDGNLPAGDYSDKIVVAITASPKQTSAFGLISTMQEMTPEICASATTPRVDAALPDSTGIHHGDDRYVPETTLTDTRDGKSYLIRKLADGNCWMGQNLELDILGSDGTYYTSTTFDGTNYSGAEVSSSQMYTKDSSGKLIKLSLDPSNTDITSTAGAWVAPTKIFTTISATRVSPNASYKWQANGNDGMRSYSYNASNPEWDYSIVNKLGTDTTPTTFQDSATGEPYERRGNLYNWTAATLGSGLKITTGAKQTPNSICPKGWQLPPDGTANDLSATIASVTDKTFIKLFRTYGLSNLQDHASTSNFNKLGEWPLQIPRNGYYFLDGFVGQRNHDGGYWTSSTSLTAGQAIDINSWSTANGGNLLIRSSHPRGQGFALRCVAH